MLLKVILPRRIIRLREIRRVTQGGLAKLARISPSTLNEIESGQLADVRLSTVARISAALDTTVGFLLADAIEPADGCARCGRSFQLGTLHPLGECIMFLHEDGRKSEWIASRVGLCPTSIEQILIDEYETRRRRRYPPPGGEVRVAGPRNALSPSPGRTNPSLSR